MYKWSLLVQGPNEQGACNLQFLRINCPAGSLERKPSKGSIITVESFSITPTEGGPFADIRHDGSHSSS